jgi:twitching motility protein PilT
MAKDINQLLKASAAKGASDLHMKVGSPPVFRIHGKLVPFDSVDKTNVEDVMAVAKTVMSPAQIEAFRKKNDLDFAYSVPGLGRFRCNAFVQRGAIGFVFRLIPFNIPSFEDLNLPNVIAKVTMEERGMVLVTGITGSGKSTTLASMINFINARRSANIVTIEDPIEYLHRDQRCIVNQREVGADTSSFTYAMRAALRQDPDVILVGEMRDMETIETAMGAAETGHLVLSTLHTTDATETVNRIISVFPPHQHSQIRNQLSSIIKGIISQRLVPKSDGKGRVPAVEVMLGTSIIKECINDEIKTKSIPEYIAQGKLHYGMQTFDQSLFDHYSAGSISYEDALRNATNPEDFKLKVKGIASTADMTNPHEEKGDDDIQIDRF